MKKSYLKRSNKPLRKKRKHRTELELLTEKADRALQDYYRTLNLKCLVCGAKQQVMHHYHPKTGNWGLRYEPTNLIPICQKCHTSHHLSQETIVQDMIILKKGIGWLTDLNALRLKVKGQRPDKEELLRILRIYQ
jgi:hypothetical protein